MVNSCLLTRILLATGADWKLTPVMTVETTRYVCELGALNPAAHVATWDACGAWPVPGQTRRGRGGGGGASGGEECGGGGERRGGDADALGGGGVVGECDGGGGERTGGGGCGAGDFDGGGGRGGGGVWEGGGCEGGGERVAAVVTGGGGCGGGGERCGGGGLWAPADLVGGGGNADGHSTGVSYGPQLCGDVNVGYPPHPRAPAPDPLGTMSRSPKLALPRMVLRGVDNSSVEKPIWMLCSSGPDSTVKEATYVAPCTGWRGGT